ncbi:hypothetical protein [Neobacillus dielmonensis]|uniref:hypothetical protein n=1 Tax=Neobacillus dielmonensis TaxID=1347369 RepID=UPI0005AABF8F|nr:hypothetical protein [Neobacillus dielmonensis]
MTSIKVNITAVQSTIPQLQINVNKLSSIKNDVRGLQSSVDYRVQNRRGIAARLHQAADTAIELERELTQLENFLMHSMEKYSKAEESIEKRVISMKMDRALSAHLMGMQLSYKSQWLDDSWDAYDNQGMNMAGFFTATTANAQKFGGAAWNYIENTSAEVLEKMETGWIEAGNRLHDIKEGAEAALGDAAAFVSSRWNEARDRFDKKREQMKNTYKFVKDNKKDLFNLLVEEGVREGLDATPTGRAFREKMEYYQYERRDQMNGPLPTYDEVKDPKSGWVLLPVEMSIYHDDGKGKPELKYINPDGREAVFNGDTLKPVTDARYKGTYNYINPSLKPEGFPTSLQDLEEWGEFASTGLGHVVTDVVPYYLVGQKNERDQPRFIDK